MEQRKERLLKNVKRINAEITILKQDKVDVFKKIQKINESISFVNSNSTLLTLDIQDLGLSKRCFNLLAGCNVKTIRDLIKYSADSRPKQAGEVAKIEIQKALAAHGLKLILWE